MSKKIQFDPYSRYSAQLEKLENKKRGVFNWVAVLSNASFSGAGAGVMIYAKMNDITFAIIAFIFASGIMFLIDNIGTSSFREFAVSTIKSKVQDNISVAVISFFIALVLTIFPIITDMVSANAWATFSFNQTVKESVEDSDELANLKIIANENNNTKSKWEKSKEEFNLSYGNKLEIYTRRYRSDRVKAKKAYDKEIDEWKITKEKRIKAIKNSTKGSNRKDRAEKVLKKTDKWVKINPSPKSSIDRLDDWEKSHILPTQWEKSQTSLTDWLVTNPKPKGEIFVKTEDKKNLTNQKENENADIYWLFFIGAMIVSMAIQFLAKMDIYHNWQNLGKLMSDEKILESIVQEYKVEGLRIAREESGIRKAHNDKLDKEGDLKQKDIEQLNLAELTAKQEIIENRFDDKTFVVRQLQNMTDSILEVFPLKKYLPYLRHLQKEADKPIELPTEAESQNVKFYPKSEAKNKQMGVFENMKLKKFSNIDPRAKDILENCLKIFNQKFPFGDKIKGIELTDKINGGQSMMKFGNGYLLFGKIFHSDVKNGLEKMDNNSREWSKGDTQISHTVYHELGHIVIGLIYGDDKALLDDRFAKLFKSADYISNYATRGIEEMLAEAIATWLEYGYGNWTVKAIMSQIFNDIGTTPKIEPKINSELLRDFNLLFHPRTKQLSNLKNPHKISKESLENFRKMGIIDESEDNWYAKYNYQSAKNKLKKGQ